MKTYVVLFEVYVIEQKVTTLIHTHTNIQRDIFKIITNKSNQSTENIQVSQNKSEKKT